MRRVLFIKKKPYTLFADKLRKHNFEQKKIRGGRRGARRGTCWRGKREGNRCRLEHAKSGLVPGPAPHPPPQFTPSQAKPCQAPETPADTNSINNTCF